MHIQFDIISLLLLLLSSSTSAFSAVEICSSSLLIGNIEVAVDAADSPACCSYIW